jgi:Fe-S-cluster-containing hydrogenase component 2
MIVLRRALLALFLAMITAAAYLHQVDGARYPNIHALCPFGGLESLYTFFTKGTFISKIFSGTMILFAVTVVLAIAMRRSFCGILCPLGAIQEFVALAGRKVFGRLFQMPAGLDRPLRYLKYLALVVTVGYAWRTAGLWMAPYDPWSAYAHLSEGGGAVWNEAPVGLSILGLTVVGSFLYDRVFCKYLCPMGAFYALIGKVSPFKVERNEEACIQCQRCTQHCPVNIAVSQGRKVTSAECLNCQTCVLNCPAPGALDLKTGKATIKPLVAFIFVLALFFGPIAVTDSLGIYKTKYERVKAGQSIDVSEVRGFMTIREAAEATGTELRAFYQKFQIPQSVPDDTKMKEIGTKAPGYDFHKAKGAVK